MNRLLGGGHSLETILVRDVGWPDPPGISGGRFPSLQWTNTSLLHRPCPKEEIGGLLGRLSKQGSGGNREASRELVQALAPVDMVVRAVRVHFLGSCLATMFKPPPRKQSTPDVGNPLNFDEDNRVSSVFFFSYYNRKGQVVAFYFCHPCRFQ